MLLLIKGRRPVSSMMRDQKLLCCFLSLLLFDVTVPECGAVCVDGISGNEAVLGNNMTFTCIFCMKREEISAETKVNWYYRSNENSTFQLIFSHDGVKNKTIGPWEGRLQWRGSKDFQDLSISIINVTLNDTGIYECVVHRQFLFNSYTSSTEKRTTIHLKVLLKERKDPTAQYSEIMMYVLLVFLTLWLLVEMIYCYRKISKSDEQAQDSVF